MIPAMTVAMTKTGIATTKAFRAALLTLASSRSFVFNNLEVDEEAEKAEESIKSDVICEYSEDTEHS